MAPSPPPGLRSRTAFSPRPSPPPRMFRPLHSTHQHPMHGMPCLSPQQLPGTLRAPRQQIADPSYLCLQHAQCLQAVVLRPVGRGADSLSSLAPPGHARGPGTPPSHSLVPLTPCSPPPSFHPQPASPVKSGPVCPASRLPSALGCVTGTSHWPRPTPDSPPPHACITGCPPLQEGGPSFQLLRPKALTSSSSSLPTPNLSRSVMLQDLALLSKMLSLHFSTRFTPALPLDLGSNATFLQKPFPTTCHSKENTPLFPP